MNAALKAAPAKTIKKDSVVFKAENDRVSYFYMVN